MDQQLFQNETKSVFRRAWHLVGPASELAKPGAYLTTDVGRESLVLVNDSRTLRGFFNVCRHRAGPLASGCGQTRRLVCRYHGWTYDLSGKLLRAPEMEGVADFDTHSIHLREVLVHRFGPLLFVALDDQTLPFDAYCPGVSSEMAQLKMAQMQHVMRCDYPVNANWKNYIDNFLEGYHIPLIHPALDRELDYDSYSTKLGVRSVLQFAPIRAAGAQFYRDGSADNQARYFWLYPNIMLNFYENQLQTNKVIPLDVDHSIVRFDWFALPPPPNPESDQRFRSLLAFSEQIQAEDAAICESVQRNFSSIAFLPGRYSRQREAGVHLFHRLVLSSGDIGSLTD